MTVTPSQEPIAKLIARSSLGTRHVRVLAAGAPDPAVRRILLHVAKSFEHPARSSWPTRIYSSSINQTRPPGSRKE